MKRNFDELFKLINGKLFVLIDLKINGKEYKVGDIITETKFPNCDLLDNSDAYHYITKGNILDGRILKPW